MTHLPGCLGTRQHNCLTSGALYANCYHT
jgi:hypothetical protein